MEPDQVVNRLSQALRKAIYTAATLSGAPHPRKPHETLASIYATLFYQNNIKKGHYYTFVPGAPYHSTYTRTHSLEHWSFCKERYCPYHQN